ncbi:hypothetical protein AN639_06435 [Candidatus Epulonipiscium fishelsonii]|uniref:Uncharacterized protein n=1 Tax=Candidatus Epulonipiscium fishelsonii TaxID=77094 RepID=A0ACC8XAS0_9FIRM|nr:hypothetical protein AN639_06435 [Epulopiscium sp. SCG-B05WGA-EpuloA1]ONI39453.1 hypothetical protein AN396_08600 [Epulopiscium sp. SCG-B11WGA-EpuloA1]
MNKEKIEKLAEKLREQKIDALVVLSRNNSDKTLPLFMDIEVKEQIGCIFDNSGKVVIITQDVYKGVADYIKDNNFEKIALNVSQNDYILDSLTIGQYMGLENQFDKEKFENMWVSSEEILGELRAIKSKAEIAAIKEAVDITVNIYKDVHKQIKVGMSETEIGDLFVEGMKKYGVVNALGSHDYSYPLVMINRCGLSHRDPMSYYILQEGDILVCDFSVRKNGYCSDIARGFYVLKQQEEKAPDDVQKAFDTAVNAVSNIINNAKAGLRGCDIDWLGRSVIEAGGYPTIRHSAGHQLGRKVHDGGTALHVEGKPNSQNKVRVNEVYAIEPTVIQDDGLPSFIVEEDIVIKEDGVEVLSERQLELWLIR